MTFRQTFSNPYDQANQDAQPETPPLDQIIIQALQTAALKLRVWLPGKVTEVLGNQKVNVQPLLQARYTNQDVITLPICQNVMVSMMMGQGWSIKGPIAVGDTGYLLFCDRSLDIWSASGGGVIDPQDSRCHDIADPIFVPGLVPFANQTTDTTTDLVLTNGEAVARLQKAGSFKFSNQQAELIDLIDQTLTKFVSCLGDLASATVNTMFGPQPLNNFAAFTALQTQVEAIQAKLDTLKGT